MATGTSNRSGYGGSCASAEATPVCRVIGANCTPRRTSSATSSTVKGRAALGISAEPTPSGEDSAKTVWYAESGWSPEVYAYRIGRPYRASSPGTSDVSARAHHSRSPSALSGSSRHSRRPPGSATVVHARVPVRRRVLPDGSGVRSSTAQRPSGPSVEKCTTTRSPPTAASTADGMVADVFTTRTSPARSCPASSRNA